MTSPTPEDIRPDVYALVDDLLPVLVPGSKLDPEQHQVVITRSSDRARVDTASLLALCAEQPSTGWPRLVDSWLRAIDRQLAEAEAGIESVEQLRLQAVPTGQADTGMITRFNSAFDLRLLADQPGSSRPVNRSELERLGVGAEEAVRIALDRTISNVLTRLDVQTQELPGGSSVRVASADGVPYVSAGITSLSQLAGSDLPHGALVGVPRHSMMIIQPMLGRRDLSTVAILEGFVASMFDGASDGCTAQLFWFVNGDAHPLGTESSRDGKSTLVLSPALAPVADQLRD